MRGASIAILLASASACGGLGSRDLPSPRARAPAASLELRPLGTASLAREEGSARQIGGLSGLDRDAATDTWYLLSDDRSQHAPARFYTASIRLDESGLGPVRVTGTVHLARPDGEPYASHGREVPDPEALRLDPCSGHVYWASESEGPSGSPAFVRVATRDGRFVSELPLPEALRRSRNNVSIEGLAFTPDASALWVALEGPLPQDGPVPSLQAGAHARFTRLDRQGRVLGQFAYPLEPIPVAPTGGRHRADNGVSEILVIDEERLLVVERSGREVGDGHFMFSIRLYEATTAGADDVAGIASLPGAAFRPMGKRLVLDLERAGLGVIDNIEAAAWGPPLRNGHATLLLASDDNFHSAQKTQWLAFELVQGEPSRAACGAPARRTP